MVRSPIDPMLDRWVTVKIIDTDTASRIRDFEATRQKKSGLRWPVLLALAIGGLMLAAGILLFIAAHWEDLSPTARMTLVLVTLAALHLGGALADEKGFRPLAITLHGLGTVACGGGIFLAAQIFNLQEHWPTGILLWGIAAAIAWALRRDWVQGVLTALLVPAWLVSEWTVVADDYPWAVRVILVFVLSLAVTYFGAPRTGVRSHMRTALGWIGGIALLPAAITAAVVAHYLRYEGSGRGPYTWPGAAWFLLAWTVAILGPLALAYLLRRRAAWVNALFAVWAILFAYTGLRGENYNALIFVWNTLSPYLLAGGGSVGIIYWGLREERKERINLGVAGVALTIVFFYFSEMLDKLDRSIALIGGGIIFLVVAWGFEKTRRRLIAHMEQGGAQ